MYITFQKEISEGLGNAISKNFDSGNYTNAILDAIFFLSQTIREKTDLDLDGINLVGKVFTGENPILKINKLKTESEKNEQKGIEFILRGLYQGIRNPRAHEKKQDNIETCYTFILLIDYLLGLIDRSKAKFDIDDFCLRIYDEDFVFSNDYVELICNEIPENKIYDTVYKLIDQRENIKVKVLDYVLNHLMKKLSDAEQNEIIDYINSILKTSKAEQDVCIFISIFKGQQWLKLDKAVRIRIENIMINSVKEGRYNYTLKKCTDGMLGLWLTYIFKYMTLENELRTVLLTKLSSESPTEINYVFAYFRTIIVPSARIDSTYFFSVLKNGLLMGDHRYYKVIENVINLQGYEWLECIRTEFDNFEEKAISYEEDDLPF